MGVLSIYSIFWYNRHNLQKADTRKILVGLVNLNYPSDGQTADAADYNEPLSTLADEFNGNIDNDNIKSGAAIDGSKLADGTVPVAKLGTSTGAWESWTPSWTNVTVGNGTLNAYYKQVGKTVFANIQIIAGSTTSLGNSASFTLPVTAAGRHSSGYTIIGSALGIDAGTNGFIGIAQTNASTTIAEIRWDAGANYTSTFPFTEASGDSLSVNITYEAA